MSEKPKANRGPSAGPENRRALIEAAREVFSEFGLAAPLSAVAKRAGVGQGSLYRHFPDRISLGVAVFDDNIAHLEALAAHPTSTLSDLFDAVSAQAMNSIALIDLLGSDLHDARTQHLATRFSAVVETMLARDHDAHRIGEHVESADIILSVSMLALVLSRTDPAERPDVARRARAIFRGSFSSNLG